MIIKRIIIKTQFITALMDHNMYETVLNFNTYTYVLCTKVFVGIILYEVQLLTARLRVFPVRGF